MYILLKVLGQLLYFGAAFVMMLGALLFTDSGLTFCLAVLGMVPVLFVLAYLKVVHYEPWLRQKFTE
jgi:hypothetical protein